MLLALALVDVAALGLAMAEADYRYVLPAVVFYFVSLWLRSRRWRAILSGAGRRSIASVYSTMVLGYAANNVLPARLGEAVRAWSFCRRNPGVYGGTVFATIVVERLFDAFSLSVMAVLSVVALLARDHGFVGGSSAAFGLLVLFGAVALVSLGVFGLLLSASCGVGDCWWARTILTCVPRRFRPAVFRWVLRAERGVAGMRSFSGCGRVAGWTTLSFVMETAAFMAVAYGFGVDAAFGGHLSLWLGMVVTMVSANYGGSVPVAFGGVGTFEVAATRCLVMLGVGAEVALGHVLVVHLLVTWLPVNFAGLVVLGSWSLSRRD